MWSSIKGADNFFRAIVVRVCGRFLEGFVRLVVLYCNSYEGVCQEVSRVNIWDAVVKEKGRGKRITVEQIIRSLNSFGIPLAIWRKK